MAHYQDSLYIHTKLGFAPLPDPPFPLPASKQCLSPSLPTAPLFLPTNGGFSLSSGRGGGTGAAEAAAPPSRPFRWEPGSGGGEPGSVQQRRQRGPLRPGARRPIPVATGLEREELEAELQVRCGGMRRAVGRSAGSSAGHLLPAAPSRNRRRPPPPWPRRPYPCDRLQPPPPPRAAP